MIVATFYILVGILYLFPFEWGIPEYHSVSYYSDCPNISFEGMPSFQKHLRADVVWGAANSASPLVLNTFGEAKVTNLHLEVVVYQ